jgi:glycine oxidase
MSVRFDVVVVGGGVIGCSVAYHLAKKRARVVVIERDLLGGQASSVAAGMLAAQEEAAKPGPFFDAGVASRDMFKDLVADVKADSGIDPEFETCGIWRIAETEDEKKALLEKKRWQEERGMPVEWWTPETLKEKIPALRGPVLGGIFCPRDGQVDSAKWVRGLAEASRYRGVRVVERVARVEFVREGGEVKGVRTLEETFLADAVVIAAGSWTPFLLQDLGVTLPLEPVKGQLLVLEGFPRLLPGPLFVGGGYFAPKFNRLIVGGTMEKAGFDVRPTLSAQRKLSEYAVRWCPELDDRQVVDHWAGLRPGSADDMPVIGALRGHVGAYVCAGHFRNGVLFSPLTGRLMAEGLAEGRWDPILNAFSPDRFLGAGKKN